MTTTVLLAAADRIKRLLSECTHPPRPGESLTMYGCNLCVMKMVQEYEE